MFIKSVLSLFLACSLFACFFIYRHWPTLLSCTLHRPRSSTSETCSCSVRSVSAVGCYGLSHSTDFHSCPCRGWSCCRSGPACLLSPSPGPAHRNLATFQSRRVRWCLAAADACDGGDCGGCSDGGDGGGGCDGYGGCCGCCGESGLVVRCSDYEPWWAWRCGSVLWGLSRPPGIQGWPASRSLAGSSLMSRGTCISSSCGRAPPVKKHRRKQTKRESGMEWGSEQRRGRGKKKKMRKINGFLDHRLHLKSDINGYRLHVIFHTRFTSVFFHLSILLSKLRFHSAMNDT